ncbi:MAG: TonB-dependent receptor [Pseudomonadota bacterium]
MATTCVVSMIGTTSIALAQEEVIELETILVTATKRPQTIQDVPISVQVVTGELMRARNSNDLEDITDSLPAVTVTDNGVSTYLYIRGVGSGENEGFEQSVGTFIDGIYVGRGRQSRQQMLDLERVEVLRGPQSVFFGNSAIAGAFNITTAGPTDDWSGYATALYETELDGKELEGAVGGPITDTLGIRVAARYGESDGWVRNVVNDETAPAQESYAFRATLGWTPTDTFDATYKVSYSENEILGTPYEGINCPPDPFAPGLSCILRLTDPAGSTLGLDFERTAGGDPVPTTIFPFNGPIPDNFEDEFALQEQWLHSLTANWELSSGHVISSVTGYLDSRDNETYDPDQTRFGVFAVDIVENFNQFSQELRLTSPSNGVFEYMLGGYFHRSNLETGTDFRVNLAFPDGTPAQLTNNSFEDQDERLFSIFAQAKYYVTDALALSFGGRYTNVKKDYLVTIQALNIDGVSAPTPEGALFLEVGLGDIPGTYTSSLNNDDFMPEVVIEYEATEDIQLYAKYTDGFKAGGFDGSFTGSTITVDPPTIQFEPEEVTSFEIGAKTTLLDGAMQLNVAAFRNKYSNLQVALFDATTTSFIVDNAGSSISQGIEVNMQYRVDQHWQIDLAASYLDAFYEDFTTGPCTIEQRLSGDPICVNQQRDLTGESLQFAPDFSGTMRITYSTPIFSKYEFRTAMDLTYSDEYFPTLDNDPDFIVDDGVRMNLRIDFSQPDVGWRIGFLARNLTNRDEFTAGINWPGADGSKLVTRERPRTFSIIAGYNF